MGPPNKALEKPSSRSPLSVVWLDGYRYTLGSAVYVRLDLPKAKSSHFSRHHGHKTSRGDGDPKEAGDSAHEAGEDTESAAEEEDCRVCGEFGGTMVECDRCLGGFHLSCLDPPLEAMPQDLMWFCPACLHGAGQREAQGSEKGSEVKRKGGAGNGVVPMVVGLPGVGERRRRRTLRERFFDGELAIGRIERWGPLLRTDCSVLAGHCSCGACV